MLEVLVLGPVDARHDGRRLRLGGRKQRALLARLALADGRPVPPGVLVEDLWDDPPRDPGHALQAQVSRLRAALPVDVELTAGGYALAGGAVRLDAAEFTRHHDDGCRLLLAGSPADAATRLADALALWRGPPLADLPGTVGLRPEAVRLEALRQSALADRIDADLACGSDRATPAELQALVEQHPLAERFWAQLMTALYGQERQGEALDVYRRAREVLAERLGTEPGDELRRLHQDVLRGRPVSGLLPRPAAPPAASTRARPGRDRGLQVLADGWDQAQHGTTPVGAAAGSPDPSGEQVSSPAGGTPAWRAAHALALTEVGRRQEAEAILEEFAAEGFTRLPPGTLWLQGMSHLCQTCAALDRPDIARALYDLLAPHAGRVADNGTVDAGPADFHLGTMALTFGDRPTADEHLAAAVDQCGRIDAPLWLARARARQAFSR